MRLQVRFSRSRPGSFALSFVWGDGRILSVLITGCMPEVLSHFLSACPHMCAIILRWLRLRRV
jgi:hypothetical protein